MKNVQNLLLCLGLVAVTGVWSSDEAISTKKIELQCAKATFAQRYKMAERDYNNHVIRAKMERSIVSDKSVYIANSVETLTLIWTKKIKNIKNELTVLRGQRDRELGVTVK